MRDSRLVRKQSWNVRSELAVYDYAARRYFVLKIMTKHDKCCTFIIPQKLVLFNWLDEAESVFFFGLSPKLGSSVYGARKVSKKGDTDLMFQFYLPCCQCKVASFGCTYNIILKILIIANYIKTLQYIFIDKISIIKESFKHQFSIRYIFIPCVCRNNASKHWTKIILNNFIFGITFYVVHIL